MIKEKTIWARKICSPAIYIFFEIAKQNFSVLGSESRGFQEDESFV